MMRRMKSKQVLNRMAPQQGLPRAQRISPVSQGSLNSSVTLTNLTRKGKMSRGGSIFPNRSMRFGKKSSKLPKFSNKNTIDSGFTFSALDLDENALVDAAAEMLFKMYIEMRGGEKRARNIASEVRPAIYEFVNHVKEGYYESRFHNFYHAVDVTQLMYTLINNFFKKKMRKTEMFYVLVVCLCHDISHPGAGTPFLRENNCLSAEMSLEGYHIQQTLDLIGGSDLILFSEKFLRPAEKQELISYAKHLIDATDISKHGKYLEAAKAARGTDDFLPKEHIAILIKVSDLANVVRGFKDSRRWSENLQVEIRAEGEYKRLYGEESFEGATLGTTFAVIEDVVCRETRFKEIERKLNNIQKDMKGPIPMKELATPTMGFIKGIVRPLSLVLQRISPEAGNEYCKRLNENTRKWHMK